MFDSKRKKKTLGIIGGMLLTVFALPQPVAALSISVHVPEKYTDVEAGERFYFEIDVKYPENPNNWSHHSNKHSFLRY